HARLDDDDLGAAADQRRVRLRAAGSADHVPDPGSDLARIHRGATRRGDAKVRSLPPAVGSMATGFSVGGDGGLRRLVVGDCAAPIAGRGYVTNRPASTSTTVVTDASPSEQVRRLRRGDRDLARRLFAVMADVFAEPCERLSDKYLDDLLARETFWAIAALAGDDGVGGLTAHSLPMTPTESGGGVIYDVALPSGFQRSGVGRRLVTVLCDAAKDEGLGIVFVPVDSADEPAVDFYRALGGVPAPVTIFTFLPGQP